MESIVKFSLLFLLITKSECSIGDCHSDLVFLNKNLTSSKNSEDNFTDAVRDVVSYNEWNQVIKDNKTSDGEILQHDFVPQISSFEQGEAVLWGEKSVFTGLEAEKKENLRKMF